MLKLPIRSLSLTPTPNIEQRSGLDRAFPGSCVFF